MLFTHPACFYTYTTHLLCVCIHICIYVCACIYIRYIYIRYIYIYKVKVKFSRYRPSAAQKVGRGIALFFHDRGTRRG